MKRRQFLCVVQSDIIGNAAGRFDALYASKQDVSRVVEEVCRHWQGLADN